MTRIVWFEHDLRVEDNAALFQASQSGEPLLCVYFLDPAQSRPSNFGFRPLGTRRRAFLMESLYELHERLQTRGQRLLVFDGSASKRLPELVRMVNANHVYRAWHPGEYEQIRWQQLQRQTPQVQWHESDGNTLFSLNDILHHCNAWASQSYSFFKRSLEQQQVQPRAPQPTPLHLPPAPGNSRSFETRRLFPSASQHIFRGGERNAQAHAKRYFDSSHALVYKQTRNALSGFNNSTKFSPWLANGCIGVRDLYAKLKRYEKQHGSNSSTTWIFQELLWREFFYWYATLHGRKLFRFQGIAQRKPLTAHYAQRLKAWGEGNTPWALVNASMRELNSTGYISNRARQIVASCLVNELNLDWRYGAAYFEQQLVDYDMPCNWGNWQYIAGVGADTRGGRHFDIARQQELFDPDGSYIKQWLPEDEPVLPLDSTDAADWPIV